MWCIGEKQKRYNANQEENDCADGKQKIEI